MVVVVARGIRIAGTLALCVSLLAGCARRHAPLDSAIRNPTNDQLLGGMVVPLVVRSVDISSAEEQRAVFFKLSRIPDAVRSSSESNPARVIIDADGPAGAEDLPTESYPGADSLVNRIDMARAGGRLHLTLELNVDDPPKYRVQQMADYIVVRFNGPR
ncbi:MAG TPA: hypothetical protein VL403_00830 [Candidatus Kryptonia bacterium]|nr:hypothetical protein [Candidatus Kryptonia bacterium]